MEFAGYILWGFICFFASFALFLLIVLVRSFHWPLFIGYVAVAILIYTTLAAFDGLYVAWSTHHNSWRAEHHIFTSDDSNERFLWFRYPTTALVTFLALALLHLGPQRQRDHEPPPIPNT